MRETEFSQKIATVLNGFSTLPIEAKAETLTNLRSVIVKAKSKRARKTLRQIEKFFRSELQN